MRKILNVVAFAIIGGAALIYFTLGPSVFLGGPKKSAIVEVTRAVMIATSPDTAAAELAKNAQITPKGLCSNQGGSFACIVEVTVAGAPATTFVSVLKKGADGAWVAAE